MRITELIEELKGIRESHGNLHVYMKGKSPAGILLATLCEEAVVSNGWNGAELVLLRQRVTEKAGGESPSEYP